MNKQQIKAELRRSACEEKYPIAYLVLSANSAFVELNKYLSYKRHLYKLNLTQRRIFLLLVSEAI